MQAGGGFTGKTVSLSNRHVGVMTSPNKLDGANPSVAELINRCHLRKLLPGDRCIRIGRIRMEDFEVGGCDWNLLR